MRSWVDTCAEHAAEIGLAPKWADLLRAFPGGDESGPSFDLLDADASSAGSTLVEAVHHGLPDIDAAQAALFARRFGAVHALLGRQARPEAQLLRIALVRRARAMLEAPGPRAVRVRALIDYVWSQAAVLHHARPGLPTPAMLAGTLHWTPIARGIRHATIEGLTDHGPLHVNVLRCRGVRLEAVDGRGRGTFPELVAAEGAAAGVSGGFFLYSEPDIAPPSRQGDPVGLLVTAGEVRSPPTFRRAALIDTGSAFRIDPIGLIGATLTWPRGSHLIREAWTRAQGPTGPDAPSSAIVGDTVIQAGRRLPIPLAGFVLALELPVGAALAYTLPFPARAAMAGGPMLVADDRPTIDLLAEDFAGSAPPVTFSSDETFDQNLLPRMAAGLTAEGDVIFAAIDGRDFDRAPGLTLHGTADLMRALGCVRAMNLDGGSSKRMVVGGRVVDRPSTEVVVGTGGEALVRPVHSAILVFPASA